MTFRFDIDAVCYPTVSFIVIFHYDAKNRHNEADLFSE